MAGKPKSQSKSKFPKPFDWSDSLIEGVQKRAYGNGRVGALIGRIVMKLGDRKLAMHFLNHLSNLGFYGDDIWYGFTDYCRSDEEMFEACIETEDKGYFNAVLDWKAQKALQALKGKDV